MADCLGKLTFTSNRTADIDGLFTVHIPDGFCCLSNFYLNDREEKALIVPEEYKKNPQNSKNQIIIGHFEVPLNGISEINNENIDEIERLLCETSSFFYENTEWKTVTAEDGFAVMYQRVGFDGAFLLTGGVVTENRITGIMCKHKPTIVLDKMTITDYDKYILPWFEKISPIEKRQSIKAIDIMRNNTEHIESKIYIPDDTVEPSFYRQFITTFILLLCMHMVWRGGDNYGNADDFYEKYKEIYPNIKKADAIRIRKIALAKIEDEWMIEYCKNEFSKWPVEERFNMVILGFPYEFRLDENTKKHAEDFLLKFKDFSKGKDYPEIENLIKRRILGFRAIIDERLDEKNPEWKDYSVAKDALRIVLVNPDERGFDAMWDTKKVPDFKERRWYFLGTHSNGDVSIELVLNEDLDSSVPVTDCFTWYWDVDIETIWRDAFIGGIIEARDDEYKNMFSWESNSLDFANDTCRWRTGKNLEEL